MSKFGDLYENRVTGERSVVLRGDENGEGQSALVHLVVRPGGFVVGEHVHPNFTERFVCLAGTLDTRIDGVERTLTAGDEATIPPGVPHDWWNAGDVEASVLVELSPPEPRFEMLIGTLWGLANDGKTNAKGMPSPFQLALTGREFSDVIRFTKPPAPVQKVAFAVLGAIGRLRGYKPTYPEYLKPHGTAEPDPAALAAAGLTPPARSSAEGPATTA